MSFLYHPGQQLIRICNPPAHLDSLPGYNTDSDNEVRDEDCIPDPSWNHTANMPQEDVDAILYEDAILTRDQEPEIPLPPETKRISIVFRSLRLKKLCWEYGYSILFHRVFYEAFCSVEYFIQHSDLYLFHSIYFDTFTHSLLYCILV